MTIKSLFFCLAVASGLYAQTASEAVLIRAPKPYTRLVDTIQANGGRVTRQFKYIDAIAAQIPVHAITAVSALVPAGAITKDLVVATPAPTNVTAGRTRLVRTGYEDRIHADSARSLGAVEIASMAKANPNAYWANNGISNASTLHAAGFLGQGVVVAVVDSGIRPGFPHISLDNSVIGCEDFVFDGLGCSNLGNSFHGTFVAGMISANANFAFPVNSALRNAVLAECPSCFADPPVNTQIPMVGSAPSSSIYAFRVFGPSGSTATSVVMTALERVIELREQYDAGNPLGSNIQVCNMSLGGTTLNPGADLFDSLVDVALAKGIVPVISAGNSGPSSITVGSPGTALGALTVGAASLAHNERIFRRLQYGPADGALYRPFLGTQTAYFSSRGPNADGRIDPDVTVNGFANYGQGTGAPPFDISIGSGTSFSAPTVAGIAALLRQKFPGATARQIRNAIIASANPALLADGSTELDRGAGYVDAAAASALLTSGTVPDTAPKPPNAAKDVKVNIENGSSLNVRDGLVKQSISGLKPGQRADILYRIAPNTKSVVIDLANVTPALPPGQQNQLFGDDILLAVHSSKTSEVGDGGDYKFMGFTSGTTFTLNNPESGIMRITVSGDWTNAGAISANLTVHSITDPLPAFSQQGKIGHGQFLVLPVNVPAGKAQAEFRLGWREDWGRIPTNDIDLYLADPNGAFYLDGATANNPESVTVPNPVAGVWTAYIVGQEVSTGEDKFELRVTVDGKVLK